MIIKDKLLPIGYQQLEYIESTGTQWMDSGVSVTANLWIESSLSFSSTFSYNMMYGAWSYFALAAKSATAITAGSGGSETQQLVTSSNNVFSVGTKFKYHIIQQPGSIIINKVICPLGSTANTVTARHILLFGASASDSNTPYSWNGYGQGKIYYMKIYDGNILVRNFIPAKRLSDNELGLYDTVNGQFYTNQGSDTFIGGKSIDSNSNSYKISSITLPIDYQQLDYIEGTGTQYIDTGIVPTTSTLVRLKFMNLEVTGGVIFGNSPDDSKDWRLFNYNREIYFDYSSQRLHGNSLTPTTLYEFELANYYVKNLVTGKNLLTGTATTFVGDGTPLYISGTPSEPSKNRFYYIKIYEDTTLVRDFIPAKRKSDNKIGMYDKVTNQFYISGSSDSFVGGNVSTISNFNPSIPLLPTGYQQLEYLESSGTQYIDTGITDDNSKNTKLDMSVEYITTSPTNQIMGFTGNAGCGIGTSSATWWEISNPSSLSQGIKYHLEWIKSGANWTRKIDNVKTTGTNANTGVPSSEPMLLFAAWTSVSNSTVSYYCSSKIYYAKIYQDDVLVRNFVPAKRTYDNIVGLYDLITKTFYTNAGSGTFNYGNVTSTII